MPPAKSAAGEITRMPSDLERISSGFSSAGPSLVEAALTGLCRAARPLCQPTRFTGRLGRKRFGAALLVASAVLILARTVDLLVFGSIPGEVPAFFVLGAAAMIALPVPALCTRRLRDAGAGARALLLALVPGLGWIALILLLCRGFRFAHR